MSKGTQAKQKPTMYNIPYFIEEDKQVVLDLIEQNPLAFLTGSFLSG